MIAFLRSLVVFALLLPLGYQAFAQSRDAAVDIEAANRALDAGDYQNARDTVSRLLMRSAPISRAERGEAFRILALLNFFEGKSEEARAAFLEFLRTDPDAHLDPALVPPEAISLLEDVRARNSAALDAFRKKPKKKRYLALNLVPSAGQFQNGESTKGILIATGLGLLLSANLTSYFLFKRYCDSIDRTCMRDGNYNSSTARSLQSTNVLTGVGLISLYAYSVVDGWLGYRRIQRRERHESESYMSFEVAPQASGATFSWSHSF